jgi:hypothetical protein
MLLRPTLLLESDRTPRAVASGVVLAQPEVVVADHEGRSTRRLWLHGVIAVEARLLSSGPRPSLPRGAFLAAVTEAGQISGITSLSGDREVLSSPVAEVDDERGHGFTMPFSIDLEATLGPLLLRDACHIHVSFERHVSEVLRVALPRGEPPSTSVGAEAPIDALLRGYALCRAGWFTPALGPLVQALADPRIAADVDGAHLYNAACAASLSAAASAGAVREELERQGLDLLREDRARLAPLLDAAAQGPREGRGARALARRREALKHRVDMVDGLDPDLAHLRSLPGWAAAAGAR